MGKVIDAEFGGRGAGDRYCAPCRERFPRRSTLCPRCGGPLTLWATHAAGEQRQSRRRTRIVAAASAIGAVLVTFLLWLVRGR